MKDNFLRWLARGQKKKRWLGHFVLAFEETDIIGKIHQNMHKLKQFHPLILQLQLQICCPHKLHLCVNQQTKGRAQRSGSTWIIRWEEKAKQSKGWKGAGNQDCSDVERNKEKNNVGLFRNFQWLCSISELKGLTGTQATKPSNTALLSTILCGQAKFLFKIF